VRAATEQAGRRGRRPGPTTTRAAILEAALALFAERDYGSATVRAIARRAGVDAALVHHFFGTKQGVFSAAIAEAFDPGHLLGGILEGGPDGIGERVVRAFLAHWEDAPARSPLLAIVRSALSNDEAAVLLRDFITAHVVRRIAESLRAPDPELRAALVGSQLIGFMIERYVIRIAPLATLPPESVVRYLAPALQRYLTAPLWL
jgi:AcrR family transcriptional regulator